MQYLIANKKQGGWVLTVAVLLVLIIALAVLYIITSSPKNESVKEPGTATQKQTTRIEVLAEPPKEIETLFVPDPISDTEDIARSDTSIKPPVATPTLVNGNKKPQSEIDLLILGAVDQYGVTNSYNGAYQKLSYPNGDVDISTGVCTDVVIRAFRSIRIDLQKEIHRDMSRHFLQYPQQWGLKTTDKNIDHRRVANMATYFTRKGYQVPIGKSTDKEHYKPGDLVVWRLSGKLTHIGIVTDEIVPNTSRYFIIHNPVQGVEISDWLNEFEIISHFRLHENKG